jgi:hypothetical protein
MLVGSLVVAAIGGVLNGCERQLTAGDAGSAGTGGGSGGSGGAAFGEPACPSTVVPGVLCSPSDLQRCYRPCGPDGVGVEAVPCWDGMYRTPAGCVFEPSRDYSCYAIPTVANADCPASVPIDSMDCGTVPHCVVCNSAGGLQGGLFGDATLFTRQGYCVCQPPNAAGLRTWSCGSDVKWPCPTGIGCQQAAK